MFTCCPLYFFLVNVVEPYQEEKDYASDESEYIELDSTEIKDEQGDFTGESELENQLTSRTYMTVWILFSFFVGNVGTQT